MGTLTARDDDGYFAGRGSSGVRGRRNGSNGILPALPVMEFGMQDFEAAYGLSTRQAWCTDLYASLESAEAAGRVEHMPARQKIEPEIWIALGGS